MASTRELRGAIRRLRLQLRKPPGTIQKIEAIVRLEAIAERVKELDRLLPQVLADETEAETSWRQDTKSEPRT